MNNVRIGVIGVGNIGSHHVKYLESGRVKGAKLSAVCDVDPDRLKWVKENISNLIECFDNFDELLQSGSVDAIIIAIPHYFHPEYAIKAMRSGIHVMCEKPAGVYTKQVREMNEVADGCDVVFGIMFNQRTTPIYTKVKDLISAGELGEIRRVNFTVTDAYRPQAYHNSSSWRGTWDKEGGGALINQYSHHLDLWQRICGMPSKIKAFCYYGKRRSIEVEDEVMAYAEYPNGATGTLICSTTEMPGTVRLELAGDRGKIVAENNKLTFFRAQISEPEFNKINANPFGAPDVWECDIPFDSKNFIYREGHIKITQNWVNTILHGEKLLSPGKEGILSVEILNAIYLSSWLDQWIDIPVDEDLYFEQLQERVKESQFVKPEVKKVVMDDMTKTF